MPPSQLFAIAWVGWIFTWAAASFWSGRTEKRLATGEVWAYRVSSLLGLILLSHFTARALGLRRMWHVGYNGAYLLALLTFGGIFFAWWARIHLGRLWSGSITRKEGHHVVDTGPYGLVRHPIYTGLIGATIATATAVSDCHRRRRSCADNVRHVAQGAHRGTLPDRRTRPRGLRGLPTPRPDARAVRVIGQAQRTYTGFDKIHSLPLR